MKWTHPSKKIDIAIKYKPIKSINFYLHIFQYFRTHREWSHFSLLQKCFKFGYSPTRESRTQTWKPVNLSNLFALRRKIENFNIWFNLTIFEFALYNNKTSLIFGTYNSSLVAAVFLLAINYRLLKWVSYELSKDKFLIRLHGSMSRSVAWSD